MVMRTLPGIISQLSGDDSLLTDLVSWWSLDEESGTRFDSHGSVDLTDNNTVGFATGKVGNAADFEEGNSEYLSNTSASALGTATDFTIAFWFNMESLDAALNRILIRLYSTLSTPGTAFIALFMNSGYTSPSTLRAAFYTVTGNTAANWSTTNLSAGTFYQAVLSYDVSTKTMSMQVNNGTAVTQATTGTDRLPNADEIYFSWDGVTTYTDGLIDEVGIWHRLLTTEEITRLYNSGSGIGYPG